MSEQKKYTSQEMRESASTCETVEVADQFYSTEMDRAAAMLRQAADSEEENAKLKATLAAVQKSLDDHQDCHKCKSYPHCDGSGCICAVAEITKILRVARGKSNSENAVGNKYKILDAKTGEEKKGKYFCLRIDANDPVERDIVNGALVFYANMQDDAGRWDYAENIRKFIAARGEGGAK